MRVDGGQVGRIFAGAGRRKIGAQGRYDDLVPLRALRSAPIEGGPKIIRKGHYSFYHALILRRSPRRDDVRASNVEVNRRAGAARESGSTLC